VNLAGPDAPAVDLLRDLVAIYDAGRREPLPLPLKTSFAWAQARYDDSEPMYAAGSRWRSGTFPGDDAQPAHVRAWGHGASLTDLMQPLRPGEEHPGEDNRLGAYAARLWLPLLDDEGVAVERDTAPGVYTSRLPHLQRAPNQSPGPRIVVVLADFGRGRLNA
jgi:exodeoxyribonuclease V gamma subunit